MSSDGASRERLSTGATGHVIEPSRLSKEVSWPTVTAALPRSTGTSTTTSAGSETTHGTAAGFRLDGLRCDQPPSGSVDERYHARRRVQRIPGLSAYADPVSRSGAGDAYLTWPPARCAGEGGTALAL